MAKSLYIDMDMLLAPLSDQENMVGEDFRDSVDPESSYLTLKDSRADARRAERESASAEDSDSSPLNAALRQWEDICDLGGRLLAEKTKDLEIASWVCEGLVRTNGFAGLAGGLDLLARLVEAYWDEGLYPVEDEDGVETRIAPLSGLIGREMVGSLVQPIKLLPISEDGSAAFWSVEVAQTPVRSDSSEAREQQAERAEALVQAIIRSSPDYLRALRKDIAAALANLDRLMRAVDGKTGLGGFGTQVATPLNAIAKLLDDRVGALFVEAATAEEIAGEAAEVGEAAGAGAGKADGSARIRSRDQMLADILEIAAFFDRTEPQSLVGLSLREVVRRARMPVEELILELIPDEMQRHDFLLRSGIRRNDA